MVFAVEQGRKIYDNLTKYTLFVLVLLVISVPTFLGATLFNIAACAPFTPGTVLTTSTFDGKQMNWAAGPVVTRHARRQVVSLPPVPGEHVTTREPYRRQGPWGS